MSHNTLYFPPPPPNKWQQQQQQQQQQYQPPPLPPPPQQYQHHHQQQGHAQSQPYTPLPPPPPLPPSAQQQPWASVPASSPPPVPSYNPATFNTYVHAIYSPQPPLPPPPQQQQQQQHPSAGGRWPTQSSTENPSKDGNPGSAFYPAPQSTNQPLPVTNTSGAHPHYHQIHANNPPIWDFVPSPSVAASPLPSLETGTGTGSVTEPLPALTQPEDSHGHEVVVEEIVSEHLLIQESVAEKGKEVEVVCFELPVDETPAFGPISERPSSPTINLQSLESALPVADDGRPPVETLCLSEHDLQEFDELIEDRPAPNLPPRRESKPDGDVKGEEEALPAQYAAQVDGNPPPLPSRKHLYARENPAGWEQVTPAKGATIVSTPWEEKSDIASLASQDSYPPPPYSVDSFEIAQPSSSVQYQYPAVLQQQTTPQVPMQQQYIAPHFPVPQQIASQVPVQQYIAPQFPVQQNTISQIPVHQNNVFQIPVPQIISPPTITPAPTQQSRPPLHQRDTHESGKFKRFVGDTLVGRAARSGLTTAKATVKTPSVLSPWGDNNPVSLPNVRYRDAILFGTFAVIGAPIVDSASDLVTNSLGVDSYVAELVSSGAGFITGNTVVKYGIFQIVEQGIDKAGLERMIKEAQTTVRTTCCLTILASIRHKLLDTKAEVKFVAPYPARSRLDCAKGWFVPYLFATCRVALVPRASDFAMAEVWAPGLAADCLLAHDLVSKIPHVVPFCDPNPTAQNLPYARLLITFIGISPLRAGMWSTSRRPGCARLNVHLFDGCPGLVIPVPLPNAFPAAAAAAAGIGLPPGTRPAGAAPVVAWSPWTLRQMLAFEQQQQQQQYQQPFIFPSPSPSPTASTPYSPARHYDELCTWILSVVDRSSLDPRITAAGYGAFEGLMGHSVGWLLRGARGASAGWGGGGAKVFGVIDPDQAGVVAFRY